MIGGLIMAHSDDKGLVLPPKIAPIQVVIVPIWKSEEEKAKVLPLAEKLFGELKTNFAVKMDVRDYMTVGERFYQWEKEGVPVRIEIGPKDIENDQVVIARRDIGEKSNIKTQEVLVNVKNTLDSIQTNLFDSAKKMLKEKTYIANSYDELKDIVENKNGFALAHWDGTAETEAKIKEETKEHYSKISTIKDFQ
jgi:prolyl-tRNA synthetase